MWIMAGSGLLLLFLVMFLRSNRDRDGLEDALVITILAYTNISYQGRPVVPMSEKLAIVPTNTVSRERTVTNMSRRAVLVLVSNQWSRPIRWVQPLPEIEGSRVDWYQRPRAGLGFLSGPNLVGTVLESGESFVHTIDALPVGPRTRWRIRIGYREHTYQDVLMDLKRQHDFVPLKIGPIVLVDPQQLMNPTNHLVANSGWMVNAPPEP